MGQKGCFRFLKSGVGWRSVRQPATYLGASPPVPSARPRTVDGTADLSRERGRKFSVPFQLGLSKTGQTPLAWPVLMGMKAILNVSPRIRSSLYITYKQGL